MFKYAGVRITYRGDSVDVRFHVSAGKEHLKDGKHCPAYIHDPDDDKVVSIFQSLPHPMSRNDAIRYIIDDPKFAEVRNTILTGSTSSVVREKLQSRYDELIANAEKEKV